MKLTELNPHWVISGYREGDDDMTSAQHGINSDAAQKRHGMGISFGCPKCDKQYNHRLVVYFSNPLDGGPKAWWYGIEDFFWNRTGNTFETLTLSPSINWLEGHWHGFIKNGEIINT
jgi:hypothetical protein